MSVHLEKELSRLKNKLLQLSSMAEQNVQKSIRSLQDHDEILAHKVIESDKDMDQLEVEIEEDCLKILALYTPVATDLRLVIALLKINNDLERIGDLAVNICERSLFLIAKNFKKHPVKINEMFLKTKQMLHLAINALIQQDAKIAYQVCQLDAEIDHINDSNYAEIYAKLKQEGTQELEEHIHFLSISKNLERIADNATNIAEDVIYMIDGKIVRHKQKYDSY